jgi:hypothetical protein
VVAARRARALELGRLYIEATDDRLYVEMGFGSAEEMAASFEISQRSLQRHAELVREVDLYPEVAQGLDLGLDLDRAVQVASIATEETVGEWLRIAGRTGAREFRRAVQLALHAPEEAVRAEYLDAIAEATGPDDRVALRASQRPAPPRSWDDVHPDLPEAARWFLDEVRPEPQHGVGKIKETQRFTCQNPECCRRTLRCDAHHVIWRSKGGDDRVENLATACKGCHLRLIHTGIVTVERVGSALLWTYPGRRVWVR